MKYECVGHNITFLVMPVSRGPARKRISVTFTILRRMPVATYLINIIIVALCTTVTLFVSQSVTC